MVFEVIHPCDRTHKGKDFVASFWKRKSNTIMVEDMWFNAVLKINYFDELLTTLKEMEKGYDKVKNTVNVSVVSDDFIKVDITNTGTTSLTIERVKYFSSSDLA